MRRGAGCGIISIENKKEPTMDYKQKFIEYYQANIHREGADRLLEWLQTTDFFTAPASTGTG